MTLTAAVVREQGQDFAVLLVKDHVLRSLRDRDEMLSFGRRELGVRTALMSESLETYGDADIVNWLGGVLFEQLPWAEYTLG